MATGTLDPPTRHEQVTFSTTEVVTLAGASYRQLDYWSRCGVFDVLPEFVATPGSGVPRRWTPEHVQALTVCSRIADSFTDDTSASRKNIPTAVLRATVTELHRAGFPTHGLLLVAADVAIWSDDPDQIVASLLAGPAWLVLPLRAADRPAA